MSSAGMTLSHPYTMVLYMLCKYVKINVKIELFPQCTLLVPVGYPVGVCWSMASR